MINYDEVIAFLEKERSHTDVVDRFKQAYQTFCETGKWQPAYEVRVAGWQHLDGVMLLEPEQTLEYDYQVHISATNERSLRELLLAFPRRHRGLFHLTEKWIEDRISDVIDGESVQTDDGSFYQGVKRGSRTKAEQRTVLKRKDAIVSHFRKLTSLKGKIEHAQFIAEDALIVQRAVADGFPIESLLYTPEYVTTADRKAFLVRAVEENLSVYQVSTGVMGSITSTRPVPTIMASIHTSYPNFLSASGHLNFHADRKSMLLIAEDIGNPDNLGMTLRTADAAGVSAVLLSETGAHPYHKNCIRASRGAVGRLPLFQTPSIIEAIAALRSAGWCVLGATAGAKNELYTTAFSHPIAIVVGNENTGLSVEARESCTTLVRIPMASGQSSLNVGVAAGVLLYAFVQRYRI